MMCIINEANMAPTRPSTYTPTYKITTTTTTYKPSTFIPSYGGGGVYIDSGVTIGGYTIPSTYYI